MAIHFDPLPAPVVERIGRFRVVRDDYLRGGLKDALHAAAGRRHA